MRFTVPGCLLFVLVVCTAARAGSASPAVVVKHLPRNQFTGAINNQTQNNTGVTKLKGGPYYENPFDVAQCSPTEANITINGLPGAICSPPCIDMGCPEGPGGIAARASCALQSGSGEQYCALLCDPEKLFASQCGSSASCKPLVGIGICTYDGP